MDKISKACIDALNQLSDIEANLSKINASIFIRKCKDLMKEKFETLNKLLNGLTDAFDQKEGSDSDYINKILTLYTKKLNEVYNEIYLDYLNLQNVLGNVRLNQKSGIINYRSLTIESNEINVEKSNESKYKLKTDNNIYNEIINSVEEKMKELYFEFESYINENFKFESSLQVTKPDGFFQKFINRLTNLIIGKKKYINALKSYENAINEMNSKNITEELRSNIEDFLNNLPYVDDSKLEEVV